MKAFKMSFKLTNNGSSEISSSHIENGNIVIYCYFIVAPFAPENLTVSIPGVAGNSTTLLVNWERPLCDRGILSGYELCYVESSVGDCYNNGTTVNITGADQLSYNISGLSINTNYTVEVRGRTGAGLGDPASANGTTDEDGEL